MLLRGVGWKEYVILRELLDSAALRMTYLGGLLELMSPSPEHESWKKNVARLVELYAFIKGIDLRGYGSTTFKREAIERGAEPDECYLIGKKLVDFPEIVLEVVHTKPLLDKLAVYAGFGVAEVWVFEDGAFTLYLFDAQSRGYRQAERSALMPDLDHAMVARYVARGDSIDVLRDFEREIRGA